MRQVQISNPVSGAPDPYAIEDEDLVVVDREDIEQPSKEGSRHSGSRHSGRASARRVRDAPPKKRLNVTNLIPSRDQTRKNLEKMRREAPMYSLVPTTSPLSNPHHQESVNDA